MRVFEHFALLQCAHPARSVRPVVFYLTPGAEGRAAGDQYLVEAEGVLVCDFRFQAVRLWELDANDLLARPAPALWAVVPLARAPDLELVRRAGAQLVDAVPDEGLRRELLALLYVIAGTRFVPARVRALLPWEVLMQSATYDEIVREGERKGRLEGEAKGKAEGKAEALLAVLAARGWPILPAQQARVRACTDPALLDAWIAAAVTAPSAEEALAPQAKPRRGRKASTRAGRPGR